MKYKYEKSVGWWDRVLNFTPPDVVSTTSGEETFNVRNQSAFFPGEAIQLVGTKRKLNNLTSQATFDDAEKREKQTNLFSIPKKIYRPSRITRAISLAEAHAQTIAAA